MVPRIHVRNIADVTDRNLIEAMLSYGHDVLAREAAAQSERILEHTGPTIDFTQARFSFHVSPYNSVDHLHLHCQLPPFISAVKDIMCVGCIHVYNKSSARFLSFVRAITMDLCDITTWVGLDRKDFTLTTTQGLGVESACVRPLTNMCAGRRPQYSQCGYRG